LSSVPAPARAFEHAHVDHTLVDLSTLLPGSPKGVRVLWITVLLCSHSRLPLAFVLSHEPPSYRSVLLVLRESVCRHNRLPDAITVDGGKEFQGTWFETTCALYHVRVHRRAKAKPRYGAEMERFFGTLNTEFLHTLVGNTQNTRNVRAMTPEVDPFKAAIWTQEALQKQLEKFIYQTYPDTTHSTLGRTPRQVFEDSLATHGRAPHRFISYDEQFLIRTSATTRTGEARVQPDGVVIKYFQYNHPALQKHLGESVKVRFDPFNLSVAWAQVDGSWLKLTSRHASLLVNYTEHDVQVLTDAWRKRRSDVKKERLDDRKVATLLKESMAEEERLAKAKRDLVESAPDETRYADLTPSSDAWTRSATDAADAMTAPDESILELCEDL
jgi:putative transposase